MTRKKKMIGGMVMIMAVTLLFSVPALAQGPERGPGNRLPGIPGGGYGLPALNNPTDVLVGVLIGGLLIYTIENSQHHDQDRYYTDRDRDRQRDWDQDHRRYDPKKGRHDERYDSRYDRDHRYDTSPWDRDSNRHPQRYPR